MLKLRVLSCLLAFYFPLTSWSSNALLTGLGNVYLIERNDSWGLYTATRDGQRVCYLLSLPIKHRIEESIRGGDAAIMVTMISGAFDEVSVTFGVKSNGNPVILIVNKKPYTMAVIDENVAWAESADTDSELVSAFKSGVSVHSIGYTEGGSKVEDVYSLKGFSESYTRMKQLCSR